MQVKHNIDPIYDSNSQVLILGSMPSIISRENSFYYANKNNRFWKIMSNIFLIDFNNSQEKKDFLLANKIALWDVIKSCNIDHSDDSSIKNVKVNDIKKIIKASNIKIIFCTGKKAYKIYNDNFKNKINIPCYCLSSPSSANANSSLEILTKEYQIIKDYL